MLVSFGGLASPRQQSQTGSPSGSGPSGSVAASADAVESDLPLAGRAFRGIQVTEAGFARPVVAGTSMSVVFIDSTHVGARAGCNSFGAMYRLHGPTLVIRNEVETLIACTGDLDSQEEWLFDLLRSSPVIVLSGHALAIGEGDRQADFLEVDRGPLMSGSLAMHASGAVTASLD